MREFRPIPDPSGALQPPNRRPPTAVAAATPMPEPEPKRVVAPTWKQRPHPRLELALQIVLGIPIELAQLVQRRVRRGIRRRRKPANR